MDGVMLMENKYSDETAKALAEELLGDERTWRGKTIAVVSAPSVFVQLKNILVRVRISFPLL